ncbi:uncharacterized protein p2ry4 isoform X3 [Megalobrama amblycephala]|uniref:uncharacterized protein p2ry4 isoform X3 n=1 Tax=Megalobrama amblycephala TaxID=75352 RepID=UPI002014782C|nr:uncharacterized protein p2ry4 isoform X3 [Megalobrama amblycephala]
MAFIVTMGTGLSLPDKPIIRLSQSFAVVLFRSSSAGRAWLSAAAEWKTAYPSLSRLGSKRHGLRVLPGSLQLNSMQDLKCREKDLEERLCNGEQIHPQAPNPLSCQQQQVPATVSSNTGRNEIISNPKTHLIIPKVTVLNAYLFSDCIRPRQIS